MNLSSKITALAGGNKQAATFLFFLLLSAIIWTINALSKERVTTINIPVQYINSNTVADAPVVVSVTLKGKGFFLMNFISEVRGFKIVPKTDAERQGDTVVGTLEAIRPLLNDFKGTIEVLRLDPEQLLISGRALFSKKVAVKVTAFVDYTGTAVQKGPSVTYPDSIYVYSASPIPDTLTSVSTEPMYLQQIAQPVFRSVRIKTPGKPYHLALRECWFFLPVEKGTEIQLEIPIHNKYKAVNESYLPASVQLTCKVPLSRYHLTRAALFHVTTTDTSIGGEQILLRVAHQPHWASEVKIKPTVANRIIRSGYQP